MFYLIKRFCISFLGADGVHPEDHPHPQDRRVSLRMAAEAVSRQGLFWDLSKQVPGTNSQIRWSVEPEPHLHSRPAVRGGEPGRESREDQVCCDERIRRQSKDGGQHCFPGGSSPQLNCGMIDYFITKFIHYTLFAICNLILIL